jgi:hypothetical protein
MDTRSKLVAGFLLLCALGASAQMSPATAEQLANWWRIQGNSAQSVPAGTPGSVSAPSAPSGSGSLGGGFTLEPVNNDWPDARAKSTPRGVPGGPVVDVKAKVKATAVAGAIGRAAGKVIGPLAVGNALWDLAKELNFILDNSTGQLVVTKESSAYTCATTYTQPPQQPPSYTLTKVCLPVTAGSLTFNYGWSISGSGYAGATFPCGNMSCQTGSLYYGIGSTTNATRNLPTASSRQEFEDAIAAKSGWPTSSAISRAIADASRAGESIQVNAPRVSGPATSPGPVVTTNKPDGTVETKTTTNNYTYAGDTVTYNTTTVTNIYNPVTNTTTTETSTETPAKEPEKQTECEKNPEIIACQKVTLGELTPEPIKNMNRTMSINKDSGWGPENGTCPAPKTAVVLGVNLSMPFTMICNLATAIRPVVIGMAWLSAALAFFGLGRKE